MLHESSDQVDHYKFVSLHIRERETEKEREINEVVTSKEIVVLSSKPESTPCLTTNLF